MPGLKKEPEGPAERGSGVLGASYSRQVQRQIHSGQTCTLDIAQDFVLKHLHQNERRVHSWRVHSKDLPHSHRNKCLLTSNVQRPAERRESVLGASFSRQFERQIQSGQTCTLDTAHDLVLKRQSQSRSTRFLDQNERSVHPWPISYVSKDLLHIHRYKYLGFKLLQCVQRKYHSGPGVYVGDGLNLTEYLFRNADNYGSRTALVDYSTGRQITFEQLREEIDNVTQNLFSLGLRRGDAITIFGTNRIELVHTLCASANLGVTLALANSQLVKDELVTQLQMSKSKLLVTTPECASVACQALKDMGQQAPFVIGDTPSCQPFESLKSSPANQDGRRCDVAAGGDDVVLLPFSSGTTGLPKGVMLSHQNLCSQLIALSHPSYLPMTTDGVSINALPMAHIAGLVIGVLNALAQGGTTVILQKFGLEDFLHGIQFYRGTFSLIAPPIMTLLAKSPLPLTYDLSSMTTWYSGAAALEKSLTEVVAARLGTGAIRQGYGMTETSPATHTAPLDGWKFGSVGVPLPNTDSKIVDVDNGCELGANQEGEVWVRGPQVMLGYLDNQDATKNAFSDDGWLKTGDIGYYDDDGHYFIVDRLKDVIKYKGYQIAPAYLESILLSHPAVSDVAVVGVASPDVGEVPTAYVVPAQDCTKEQLEEFVAGRVAPYRRLRGGVHFVDEIPKSGSGKILRRLLKQQIKIP